MPPVCSTVPGSVRLATRVGHSRGRSFRKIRYCFQEFVSFKSTSGFAGFLVLENVPSREVLEVSTEHLRELPGRVPPHAAALGPLCLPFPCRTTHWVLPTSYSSGASVGVVSDVIVDYPISQRFKISKAFRECQGNHSGNCPVGSPGCRSPRGLASVFLTQYAWGPQLATRAVPARGSFKILFVCFRKSNSFKHIFHMPRIMVSENVLQGEFGSPFSTAKETLCCVTRMRRPTEPHASRRDTPHRWPPTCDSRGCIQQMNSEVSGHVLNRSDPGTDQGTNW